MKLEVTVDVDVGLEGSWANGERGNHGFFPIAVSLRMRVVGSVAC